MMMKRLGAVLALTGMLGFGLPSHAHAQGTPFYQKMGLPVFVTFTLGSTGYATGLELGTPQHVAGLFPSGSGQIEGFTCNALGSAIAGLSLDIFEANPTNSTFVDHTAPVWAAADQQTIALAAPLSNLATAGNLMQWGTTASQLFTLAKDIHSTDIWVAIFAGGTITNTASTNIICRIDTRQP